MPVTITVQNLWKSFPSPEGELKVLRGVTVEFPEESSVAIFGESGAGKSTFLHILGGLEKPTAGAVLFNGESLYEKKEEERAQFRREKVGFVFQFHYLFEDLTALENTILPLLLKGFHKREAIKKGEEILDELHLLPRKNHRPQELSGGEQQRVAIARAIIHDPEIVLMDEPTGNLDEVTAEEVHNLLFSLRERKRFTWITVTHNLSFASRFSIKYRMERGILLPA
jgi:lipoprotein-releasing system ATP-binding protein